MEVDLIWFPFFFFAGKVLVVTGLETGYNPSSLKSEVIDLSSEDTVCGELGDFPLNISGAVGTLLGDYPVICGGYTAGWVTNKCYKLNEAKQYTEFATMQKPRDYAGIIPHENKVWITGGENEKHQRIKTTEFILASGISTPGPDLPIALEKHAMAKVDLSISMIIGGYSYDNDLTYDNTWYFEHHTEKFSDGPRLLEERCDHTAGVIKDSVFTDEKRVVVVGGFNSGSTLKSVEWLVSDKWEQGNSKFVNASQNILMPSPSASSKFVLSVLKFLGILKF